MEVMGRHAGWIAAAGGLAADDACDLPIVILFPEVAFDREKFLAKVDEKVSRYGYCSVVVSEGVKTADGKFLSDSRIKDAFGHTQLGGVAPLVANMIKDALGYRFHWAVADYLQRAARHIASKTDVEQAYALGQAAVELAIKGSNAVMPAIVRKSDSPYQWEMGVAQLKEVANVEKKMPLEFISPDGFGITEACRKYLQPLIAGEDYPPYNGGLPNYIRLKNEAVPKRLSAEFKV
jgi:6-phosphofructokinase 1